MGLLPFPPVSLHRVCSRYVSPAAAAALSPFDGFSSSAQYSTHLLLSLEKTTQHLLLLPPPLFSLFYYLLFLVNIEI